MILEKEHPHHRKNDPLPLKTILYYMKESVETFIQSWKIFYVLFFKVGVLVDFPQKI